MAAGSGSRFGGNKQFASLGPRRVIDWSVGTARAACDGVVLVLPAPTPQWDGPPVTAVVAGGATRSASVRAGLAAVPMEAAVIVVHDAARPLASEALFGAVVAAVEAGADGAVPGLPVTDTLKRVAADRRVVETVDRAALMAVQTPQAFAAAGLRAAHASGADATDDAALLELGGRSVVVVPGEAHNLKITTPDDLARAAWILKEF